MPWSTLVGAGPWAAFLAGCAIIVWFYATDRVISRKEYHRRQGELEDGHKQALAAKDELIALYKASATIEAAARDRERERGDAATAQLTKLAVELPEALRQLKAGQP